jgi:two-component system LytT family sensor kinase
VIRKSRYISIVLHVLVWTAILCMPYLFKMPAQNKSGFLAKILTLRLWFASVEVDVWAYRFILFSTLGVVLLSTLYGVTVANVRLEKEQKAILAERALTELKLYRSQISPHFLFNVLSTLISFGRRKSDQLEPALIMLSELIRYMLYEAKEKKVTLAKEIEYLGYYIELQKLRFSDEDVHIEANFTVSDNDAQLTIEPMLLIPFVENAFKHGIGWIREPFIKVDLYINDTILYFDVQNKLATEMTGGSEGRSGIGLSNIQSRLTLLYGGKFQLNLTKDSLYFYLKLKLDLK